MIENKDAGQTSPQVQPGKGLSVGVIGLGNMGSALAGALLSNGYRVVAYDRNPSRIEALAIEGAQRAGRLSDLAGCEVIVTSLPDDAALASVTTSSGGLLDVLAAGSVHLSTSTVSAGLSRELAKLHAGRGQQLVVAAILGNPDLARLQRIFMLVAGDEQATTRTLPLLEKLSQRVFLLGSDPGSANLMKLASNALTAATLQSMGEVLAFLSKAGIPPQRAFDVLTGSMFDGRVHKAYGGKIVEKRYSPAGMAVPLAMKDLQLALAEAEACAAPMPVVSLVHDRLVALMSAGAAALDWSSLGALAARDAGLEPLPLQRDR